MNSSNFAQYPQYARALAGAGGTEAFRPLATEIIASKTRIWGQGIVTGDIGFSDDCGWTFTTSISKPMGTSAYGVYQLTFGATKLYMLLAGINSKEGRLYESPLPNAAGSGLGWTLDFDLSTDGGSVGSAFRNSSFAISGVDCYLLEYGAGGGVVTGGPSIFHSSSSGASGSWSNVKTFANSKHGHAAKVINNYPWVSLGDIGSPYTDVGLWSATNLAASSWSQRNLLSSFGGSVLDMINFFAMDIDGIPVLVGESDAQYGDGPLIFPSTIFNGTFKTIVPMSKHPPPYFGSMAGLTKTSEGDLIWALNGEGGAIGHCDGIWISGPPYNQAHLLEQLPLGTLGSVCDPVECGPYVFFGNFRITKPQFLST